MRNRLVLVLTFFLLGCPQGSPDDNNKPVRTESGLVCSENVGRKITLTGKAVNTKIGAILVRAGEADVYVLDFHWWPEKLCEKNLKVTGVLAEDCCLPVFVPKSGEPQKQGMPVSEGTDLERASRRYVMRNTTYEIINTDN